MEALKDSGGKKPTTPTNVVATNTGAGTVASISFTPSDYIGKDTITYTVTSSPGSVSASAVSSPITLTGLTSGTTYTFALVANTNYGVPSDTVTTDPVAIGQNPGAPTIGTATIVQNVDRAIDVTYTAGAAGTGVTTFTATSNPGGITATGSSPIRVTGLTAATAYTFTVTASNLFGSATSGSTGSVTAGNAPTAPTIGTAAIVQNVDRAIDVPFTPGSTGTGSPTYTVTTTPGSLTFTGTSPIRATGLTAGTAYTFIVSASTAYGSAVSAASNSVTAGNRPGAPTGVSAAGGNAQATIT